MTCRSFYLDVNPTARLKVLISGTQRGTPNRCNNQRIRRLHGSPSTTHLRSLSIQWSTSSPRHGVVYRQSDLHRKTARGMSVEACRATASRGSISQGAEVLWEYSILLTRHLLSISGVGRTQWKRNSLIQRSRLSMKFANRAQRK